MRAEEPEKIRGYLEYYRFLEKRRSIKENFFLSLSALLLFSLFFILLENVFFFGIKAILLGRMLFFALLLFFAFRHYLTVTFWEKKMPYDNLALLLENRFPEFNTHLINAWQLGGNTLFPPSFIDLLKKKAVHLIDKTDPCKSLNLKKLSRYKKIAAVSLLLFLLYISIFPQSVSQSVMKIFFPASTISGFIKVEPGNCSIEEGMPLTIKVYLKNSGMLPFIEIKNAEKRREEMSAEKDFFSYHLPEIKEGFSYRIISGKKNTDWYRVDVKSKTLLTKLVVTYDFPSYTGLKKIREERAPGEISALYGTGITIEALFSNPVENASLEMGLEKTLYGRGTGNRKVFRFTANNSTLYRFRYYDPVSRRYKETPKERFNMLFDRSPYIEFIEPGRDIHSQGGEDLAFKIRTQDDFGLTSLKIRRQTEKGSVSDNDPVLYQASLRGRKEVLISHSIRIPANLDAQVAYYAECTDNSPSGNKGFSSVYYIYPITGRMSGAQGEKGDTAEKLKKQAETLQKALEKFIREEKKIVEAAKSLARREDLSAGTGKVDEIIEAQNKWKDVFQKMVDDLNRIASQTKGQFTLADELVEMLSHIQSSNENLEKKAIHMAVTASQTGLELAEEITSNLEKWLAEFPDYIKWDMEEPPQKYAVPEALLPDELEDIIGELIEQEEDMREEIEDITSSWMDSLDKGAGWGAMDGPISNMSAKGITGNLMPNQQEIGGRSGEGRTGRSYGEMVEKTATGKGGRKTPARLTPDNLEPGEIQDTSGETPFGPTGGGKISGWGPEGLEGPQQSIAFRYDLLAVKQQKIIEKTESVIREMKVLNVYNPEIEKALSGMKEFQIKIKDGRYQGLLTEKNLVIAHLKESDRFFIKSRISMVESTGNVKKTAVDLGGVWDEKIPSGYENIVRQYYREIRKK